MFIQIANPVCKILRALLQFTNSETCPNQTDQLQLQKITHPRIQNTIVHALFYSTIFVFFNLVTSLKE